MEKRILYVGDDSRYWQNIQDFFNKKYFYLKYSFESLFDADLTTLDIFLKIQTKCVDVIYVDYSSNTTKHLELIKLLRNDNSTRHIIVLGLLGLDDREVSLKRAINWGVHFNHFKQVELDDLVYDALSVLCLEEITEPRYARADIEFKIKAFHIAHINKISLGSLEFETDVVLADKDKCFLKLAIPEKSLPYSGACVVSKKDYIVNSSRTNNYVASWEYALPLEEIQDEAELEHKGRQKERDDKIAYIKQSISNWIRVQLSYYISQKEIRVLIVDRNLEYKKRTLSVEHNFVCEVQSTLIDPDKEISRYKPHLIFFIFDEVDEPSLDILEENEKLENMFALRNELRKRKQLSPIPRGKNDLKMFKEIVQSVKWNKLKIEIFSFNCKIDSVALRDSINYEGFTPVSAKFSAEIVNKIGENKFNVFKKKREVNVDQMIKKLKAKDPIKYLKVNKKTFQEEVISVSNDDSLYFGNLIDDIYLTGLSEVDVSISSKNPIELYSVIRLDIPTTMYITVVPVKIRPRTLRAVGKDYKYTYRGLIHSVDENQRKLLRRCVNAANTKAQEDEDRLKRTMNVEDSSAPLPQSEKK